MKKCYVAPKMEVIELEAADIVCTSGKSILEIESTPIPAVVGETPLAPYGANGLQG